MSCQSEPDKAPNISLLEPTLPLNKDAIAIKKAITEIETSNLEKTGETLISLQINGMEIIKITRKDYLIEEKKSQQVNFKNYMQYLDRFEKTKSPLNNPVARMESQAKHNAVIKYLDQLIKKNEASGTDYKVVYYLYATTNSHNYNQLKTTYLDEIFKLLRVSYLHLKPSM